MQELELLARSFAAVVTKGGVSAMTSESRFHGL